MSVQTHQHPKTQPEPQPQRAQQIPPTQRQTPRAQRSSSSLTARQKPGWAWAVAAAGSLAVSTLITALVLDSFSFIGLGVLAGGLYVLSMYIITRAVEGRLKAVDEFWRHLIWTAFFVALLPLVSVLWSVVSKGLPTLISNPALLVTDMHAVVGATDIATQDAGASVQGGIVHGLIGTMLITVLASAISIPVGLLASIYLAEYGKKNVFSRSIRFFVDVMTGIPSIVAGLFAFAGLTALTELITGSSPQALQGVKTGVAAAVALSVLMVPVVVRSTEEMLQIVSHELREASYALGVSKWRTIINVVLPTAMSGIASGITLAIARVTGETAPILVTAGYVAATNWNPFSEWMTALPVFIYRQLTNPTAPAASDPSTARAWAGALVLIIIVMGLNLGARAIAKHFAAKTIS